MFSLVFLSSPRPNKSYQDNSCYKVFRVSLLPTSIPPSLCNVKEAVMGTIRGLKTKPSDPTRYPRADRSVHLYLLILQLDDRAIDLLLEVFMR